MHTLKVMHYQWGMAAISVYDEDGTLVADVCVELRDDGSAYVIVTPDIVGRDSDEPTQVIRIDRTEEIAHD